LARFVVVASYWYQGRYLARVSRDIKVVNSLDPMKIVLRMAETRCQDEAAVRDRNEERRSSLFRSRRQKAVAGQRESLCKSMLVGQSKLVFSGKDRIPEALQGLVRNRGIAF
jgi:hypothetical protein